MAKVLDYYSFTGLPRTSTWEEVKKKVTKQFLDFQKKANVKGPGSWEAEQKDFWAKALEFFKDEGAKKAYDAQLDAWLKSPAAQQAQATAKSAAEDFAQRSTGVLELLQQAWRELERGNVAEAMLLAGKALALDPGSWEAYFALGVANFRSSDLDEAMSCLRSAARLNPKSADVAAGIGEIYERQERWKDAYEQYRRAAEIEPDVLAHQISMGLVCVKAGVPDEGIEILRACQAKDPKDPGLNWALGVALSESARLGWTYVQEGHPRVPEGWYAMSREQALQAVAKLHEATSLRLDDPDLSKYLADLKSDVDSNVKRHFNGSWILLALLSVLAVFGSGVSAKLFVGILAAAYYGVNLVPQYATNARILAGEGALKKGFFDWLENLSNPWAKLAVLCGLIVLLPVFIVYWGIRNWTGDNAPLGNAVEENHANPKADTKASNSGGLAPSVQASEEPIRKSIESAKASVVEHVQSSSASVHRSEPQQPARDLVTAKPSQTKPPSLEAAALQPAVVVRHEKTTVRLGKSQKLTIALIVAVIGLSVAVVALLLNRSKKENLQDLVVSRAASSQKLDATWQGTWISRDGRRVLTIGEQAINAISRVYVAGKGEEENRYTLKFILPTKDVHDESVSFTGNFASVKELSADYEDSVKRYKAKEADFSIDPFSIDSIRAHFREFKDGRYPELEGYLGGDCGIWSWYNDGNQILEVSKCKYGHHVMLLKRGTLAEATQFFATNVRKEVQQTQVTPVIQEHQQAAPASNAAETSKITNPKSGERNPPPKSQAPVAESRGRPIADPPKNANSEKRVANGSAQIIAPPVPTSPPPAPISPQSQPTQVQFSCSSLPFALRISCTLEGKDIIRKCAPDLKVWNSALPGCARNSATGSESNQ